VFWNELFGGATQPASFSCDAVTQIGGMMTARSATAKWFSTTL
jgi:hypothetical protein